MILFRWKGRLFFSKPSRLKNSVQVREHSCFEILGTHMDSKSPCGVLVDESWVHGLASRQYYLVDAVRNAFCAVPASITGLLVMGDAGRSGAINLHRDESRPKTQCPRHKARRLTDTVPHGIIGQ